MPKRNNLQIYSRGGKLLKNFFDCKDGKITEKAFSHGLLISILSILLCIVALCSMTYAWFTSETTSNRNTLTSGSFDVIITVSRVEDGVAIEVDPDPTNAGKYNCILEPGSDEEAYEISLKLTDGSNVKGHCIVKIGNGAEQHTAAIIGEGIANVENATITDPFTFRITVKERTNVTLEPRWGVVVQPDIEKGNVITVGAVQSGRETE